MQDDRLLTVDEAAEIMRVHPSTIRRLVRAGELARVKVGIREYRIRHGELMRFIQENESREKPPK